MPTGTEELDIKVYIDYAQERTNQKGPFVFATDGTHIDQSSKTNCYTDPVTLSTFGMPLPMTAEWNDKTTPTTGNYSRYQIYDFTFTGTGGAVWWNFNQYRKPGNSYIFSISDDEAIQSAPIELTNDVIRNEPLFFSYSKLDKKGSDNQASFTLNWKNSTNSDKDIQLHFNSDGSCDVYRGYSPLSGNISTFASSAVVSGHNTKFLTEVTVGTYIYDQYGRLLGQVANIVNNFNLDLYSTAAFIVTNVLYNKKVPNKVQTYSRTESNYNTAKPVSTSTSPNDQFNDISIIPCRGKDLLVLTSFGLNFCHSFADLNVPNPPGNTTFLQASETPIITPSGKFSIEILNGKIAFQLAKLYFLSKWSAFSQTIKTPNPPPTLPAFFTDINDEPFAIGFDKNTKIIDAAGSQDFTVEVFPGDRVLAWNTDYQLFFVGIADTVTASQIITVNDIQFNSSECIDTIGSNPVVKYITNRKLTGTISFTLDSGIVNGTGTLFTTELELGDYLYDIDGTFIGIVQAIISDTNLALFKNTNIARTNIPYYINLNQYDQAFRNLSYEKFGNAEGDNSNGLNVEIILTDAVGNDKPFDNENDLFKIKIKQTSEDVDPLSSEDWGYMLYSVDTILNLLNEETSNTPVDITTALTQFSLQRNENGDLTCHLETRTKFLEDLGVIKPEILADRPIRVDLVPRNKLLSGDITIDTTVNVTGVLTEFTTELSVGDTIYKSDGTEIGIVSVITNDTALTLISINPSLGIEYNIDYKKTNNQPFSIFEGFLSSPQIDYILGENYNVYPNLTFSAICKKQHLNKMYFDTAPNFDSIFLPGIVVQSINMSGSGLNDPNKVDLLASNTIETYQVPLNRSNSNGQYNFGFNMGESAGSFIEQVRSNFANNFVFYHGHTYQLQDLYKNEIISYMTFYLRDLSVIPAETPPIILYFNEETAETNGGIPVYESYKRTIRSMSRTYEQPEANRIVIVGIDKSTSDRITVVLNDTASQYTPALPVNRPNNWLGEVLPFVQASEKLNSIQDVNQVAEQYFNRITTGRDLIEFESEILTWFDSTSNAVTGAILTGDITIDTTNVVTGVLTEFTTELSPGDSLYEVETGDLIGIVKTITNDTNLTLLSNNIPTIKYNIEATKNIEYLNEFTMVDIGDIISISDLEDNIENFQIIDWSFDVLKDYSIQQGINVRKAKYRAKKITVPAFYTPVFSFNVFYDTGLDTQPASNQKIIAVDDTLLFTMEILGTPPYTTNTITLTNEPANMTATLDGNLVIIEFTPDNTQANQLASNILLTCTNSDGAVITYTFSVRVYGTL